jgi:lipopolysaccharide biosynthesis glycosyltransferase
MPETTPVIALCADSNIEIGLHVTLRSLVETTSRRVKVCLLNQGFDAHFPERLAQTIAPYGDRVALSLLPIDDHTFSELPTLVGSHYPYARLLVPHLVQEPKILYLDSDLIVNLDVASLFDEPLNGRVIGASGLGTVEWQNEKNFLKGLGFGPDAPYFNTGVLLIDADRWRTENVTARCLEFASRHSDDLKAADQTILNALLHESFQPLAAEYNILVHLHSRRETLPLRPGIYHFLGQPKPWDFLGEALHPNYEMFGSVLSKTYFATFSSYRGFNLRKALRVARLWRYYCRLMKPRRDGT